MFSSIFVRLIAILRSAGGNVIGMTTYSFGNTVPILGSGIVSL